MGVWGGLGEGLGGVWGGNRGKLLLYGRRTATNTPPASQHPQTLPNPNTSQDLPRPQELRTRMIFRGQSLECSAIQRFPAPFQNLHAHFHIAWCELANMMKVPGLVCCCRRSSESLLLEASPMLQKHGAGLFKQHG